MAVTVLGLLLTSCVSIGKFPADGRVCRPDTAATEDCNCEVFVLGGGWKHRECPQSPTPVPTPSPCQFPCPPGTHAQVDGDNCRDWRVQNKSLLLDECLPDPQPTVTPTAPPSTTPPSTPPTAPPTAPPCVPTVQPFKCPAGTVNDCWACADRIAWDVERENWTPLPGSGLLYNDPGGNPQRREYLDRACNYVRRDGSIIRTAEQQFGRACVDGNAICPAPVATPCPAPTPTTAPSPVPSAGPTPAACPAIGGLGAQVHQFINAQHQTVTYHREGEGGRTYVADGPVVGGEILWDSTVYFGCGAPRCACDGDHDGCGGRVCEDPRGQSWRLLSGPRTDCSTWNNGQEGDGAPRGYGYRCKATAPGDYVAEGCTGEPWIDGLGHPVPGHACVTITARVRE